MCDTLTTVGIEKTVRIASKVIDIYEGVIYADDFKHPVYTKFFNFSFLSKEQSERESDEKLEQLTHFSKNQIFNQSFRENIHFKHIIKIEDRMTIGNDDKFQGHHNLQPGGFC